MYELRGDVIEVDTNLLGKVSTQYFAKADPKPNRKAKFVGNRRKKKKKGNSGKNPIQRGKKILRMKKRRKRIRMMRIPRKKLKERIMEEVFRLSVKSGSSRKASMWAQCHNMLPASPRKIQRGNNYEDLATHSSHHLSSPEFRAANVCKIPFYNCEYFQKMHV